MSDDTPAEVENTASHDEIVESSTTPEVQSTPAESSAAETPEEPKKVNKVQERINQLTREKYEARQENAALAERIKALEADPKPLKAPEVKAAPNEDDFNTHDEFETAKTQHIAETASNAAYDRITAENQVTAQAASQATQLEDRKVRKDSFDKNVEAKRANFQDFEEVAYNHPFMDTDLADQIFEMDKGPEVAYHLGSNLEEAERIFALDPVRRARELTKLEFQVDALKPKVVSDAPDPITPLSGSESAGEKDPDSMTADEWSAWRYRNIEAKKAKG